MISHKKSEQTTPKNKKTRKPSKNLALTPDIQALYFQCLAGKLHQLTREDQRIIITVFNQQFPSLKREAQRFAVPQKPPFLQRLVNWIFYGILVILGILLVLVVLEYRARAEVDEALIQEALHQAGASMQEAWKQGTEGDTQPIQTVVGEDGTMALAQNVPKRSIRRSDGTLDISDSHTTITIIQQPTPVPQTPPQDTRIQTTVNGLDNIETRAVLPENLVVDQLETVKKIADNGVLIAQQRFALEQHSMNSQTAVEKLRITRGLVLWGFLLAVPLLLTCYWMVRNAVIGWRKWQKEQLDHKLKELESIERQIALREQQFDRLKHS